MYFDLMVYMSLFILSLMLLGFSHKYVLMLLMLMELVVINILLLLFFMMDMLNLEFYIIYYLVFSVCESVLGLGLLVILVRFLGSDFYFLMNISKF